MSLYDELAATVVDLLADDDIAGEITLTRPSSEPSTYDASIGSATPVDPITYTGGRAVVAKYRTRDIDGTRIQRGDRMVILSTSGIVQPMTGDTITIDGETLTVVDVDVVKPGPGQVAVAYIAQVRV
ncbi:MAG: hypothetical protein IPJ61_18270 [Tessaracoccus sp.]|uniref:hypothetical protein n=1 Tax=Tessaracoccus sp. TaxID=1971211 RepID=UPI001EC09956|nr:hypothetical protein [Tessaracoccus sp.]MBK7822930.1 hypothetical protein [Tessaracoccus sp.]